MFGKFLFILTSLVFASIGTAEIDKPQFDIVIRGGTIYDGSGADPFTGDIAVAEGRIAQVGPHVTGTGAQEISASGLAVAPGFINLLSWAGEPLLVDGRAQSDLRQGVTTEIMGEGFSLGPLNDSVRAEYRARQTNLVYDLPWSTLSEALEHLVSRGVAVNVGSYVGAATIRMNVLGLGDVEVNDDHLQQMQELVRQSMEGGAIGVASALLYAPGTYASTTELVALAEVAGRCGGIYATHIRSETDRFVEAVTEAIDIGRRSGAPVEIFHLKAGGRANWHKLDDAIDLIESARESGLRISTDMYAYASSSTGLDASLPDWVLEGGVTGWIIRLQDPEIRRRVIADMQSPVSQWDNLMRAAGGGEGVLLVEFRNPELMPYVGKTVAEVSDLRGSNDEETVIDLIIEDKSRVRAIYSTMSEDNIIKKLRLPYMSIASDGRAVSAEGVFLKVSEHPRTYGNFARVLGEYVRKKNALTLSEAIYKMTGLPGRVLGLRDRGLLRHGFAADIVVFNPATIKDNSTYENSHQYATGVEYVLVNGVVALSDGEPTPSLNGQVAHGRGWRGWPDGGCREFASDWVWQ